jgi:hypothetical protein
MRPNVGTTDARIRLALGVVLLVAAALLNGFPAVAVPAAVLGVVFIGTALTRRCVVYAILGIDSTRRHPTPHTP